MTSRFLKQNLKAILFPVIIPAIILGTMAIYVINSHLREEIVEHNIYKITNLGDKLNALVDELDKININLSHSPAIIRRLKGILSQSKKGIQAEDNILVNTIIDLLSSSSRSIPYIHSLYIYLNNTSDLFLTNTDGLVRLNYFYDTDWYETYHNYQDIQKNSWSEIRYITPSFGSSNDIRILSIYRKIFASAKDKADGVLVLNVEISDINNMLNLLDIPEDQIFLVVDKNTKKIICHNTAWTNSTLVFDDLANIIDNDQSSYSLELQGKTYVVAASDSVTHWKYISLIPSETLYHIPILLTRIILFSILVTLIIALSISYSFAYKNYTDIKSIIDMISSAEKGEVLPKNPKMKYNIYKYIIHNILKTFIENSYLQVQLSEKHYRLKTLELVALQSQLNPHFLFNTMETLYWKAIAFTNSPNEVTQIVENLSDILRYVLDSDEETVLLSEEVQITKSYLNIHLIRYQNSFDVIWDYPLALQDIKIAKLILQPIVENSILHGIRNKKEKSSIKIRIRQIKGSLYITVIDSGVGMDRQTLIKLRQKLVSTSKTSSKHIGLYNTNKRIKLLYGEKYGLRILSRKGLGTSVRIILPIEE